MVLNERIATDSVSLSTTWKVGSLRLLISTNSAGLGPLTGPVFSGWYRKLSGNVKTGVVTVPSTCISWNDLPFAVASISTGGNTTGTLADAVSTSWNRPRARGDRVAA